MSEAERALAWYLDLMRIPHEREVVFAPPRKWRADFRVGKLLIEVEGGSWTAGRHVRGAGFEADCEKYAEAMLLGYRVLRVTPAMISDGRAIDYIIKLVGEQDVAKS